MNEIIPAAVASTEIDTAKFLNNLNTNVATYWTSLPEDTFDQRLNNATIIDNAGEFDEVLNKPFDLVGVFFQEAQNKDDDGNVQAAILTTLIGTDGVAYSGQSSVVREDVKRMLNTLGHPSGWEAPVRVVMTKEGAGSRKFFTLKYALAEKPAK